MSTVAIIANPVSGKDIRRIISSGLTVTSQVKQNTMERLLRGMDVAGVERAVIMPERSNMGQRLVRELAGELQQLQVDILEMPYLVHTQDDTVRATAQMVEAGVDCIVVLGGDGTSRVVSSACGDVPLLPLSAGTNNVFPRETEGTLAGLVAAALATGVVSRDEACRRAPHLELLDADGQVIDHALVDLAVIDASDRAARAVWEPECIRELYLTQARPDCIGLAAIGAQVEILLPYSGNALQVILGAGGYQVAAPIAPGLLPTLNVAGHRLFAPGEALPICFRPCMVALDGEREIYIREDMDYKVRLNPSGPLVLEVEQTLQLATRRGFLRFAGETG